MFLMKIIHVLFAYYKFHAYICNVIKKQLFIQKSKFMIKHVMRTKIVNNVNDANVENLLIDVKNSICVYDEKRYFISFYVVTNDKTPAFVKQYVIFNVENNVLNVHTTGEYMLNNDDQIKYDCRTRKLYNLLTLKNVKINNENDVINVCSKYIVDLFKLLNDYNKTL